MSKEKSIFRQAQTTAVKMNIWLPALLAFVLPLSTSAISVVSLSLLLTVCLLNRYVWSDTPLSEALIDSDL